LFANIGNWWAPDRIVAETPWRHQRIEGGGIALDIGVHLFNHFRYVAGEIVSVTGNVKVLEPRRFTRDVNGNELSSVDCDADDTLFASFETDRGVVGHVVASWSGHGQPLLMGSGRGIVYYGSAGSVVGSELVQDDGTREEFGKRYSASCEPAVQQRHFPFGLTDAFALNQFDWLRAIQEKRDAETSGREGLRDLAASFAVLESSLAKRTVEVQEVLSGDLREYQRPIDERFGFVSRR
jgi:predicted dehydrogenase